MPRTFGEKDTKLLGYKEASVVRQASSYNVIDAKATLGPHTVTTRFIYFKSDCSKVEAQRAVRDYPAKKVQLLQPTSRTVQRNVGGLEIAHLEDYIRRTLVEDHFSVYLQAILDRVPAEHHFIEPSSPDCSSVMTDLRNYLSGRHLAEGDSQIRVIGADAGVGKTTLSRELVRYLAEKYTHTETIPIYVEAQHWKRLNLRHADSLYDVIKHSMEHLDAHVRVPERDILYHAIGQGYVAFIFDGFDELCSTSAFEPIDVLDDLAELSEGTEARVLITTRMGFWNARVKESSLPVTRLNPFNVRQAEGYFRKAFGQSDEYHTAVRLHRRLRADTKPLDHTGSVRDEAYNLPFVVRVLADYVRDGGSKLSEMTLGGILMAICDRERTRHELDTSSQEQIRSFVDVAMADDGTPPLFVLDDLLSLPDGGFQESDREAIRQHALLQRQNGHYGFRYEFLAPYLRSIGIKNSLIAGSPLGRVSRVLEGEKKGEGHISENLLSLLESEDLERVVRYCHEATKDRQQQLASFFFHVALRLSQRAITSDRERTSRLLFEGMEPSNLRGWSFCGALSNLDFRGVRFVECSFTDVSFDHCVVDEQTTFDACEFSGVLSLDSGWQSVKLQDNCDVSFPADTGWEKVLGRSVGERHAHVEQLLEIALGKFWRGGTFRGSIAAAKWHRGWMGQSREAKRVLDALLRRGVIERVRISGVTEGGYAFDRESVPDLQNFMDNRRISGKIREVFDDMMSRS